MAVYLSRFAGGNGSQFLAMFSTLGDEEGRRSKEQIVENI